MPSKVELSHKTIIFTVVFLAAVWFVIEIRDIIYLLFISFIVMSALRPWVDRLEQYRIPRVISILTVYIIVFGFLGITFSSLVPLVAAQTAKFVTDLPRYESMVSPYFQLDIQSIINHIAPIGENIVKVSVGVFNNVVTTLTVLVLTFYLLLDRTRIEHYMRRVFAKRSGERIIGTINSVETSLGLWLRGELILMLFVGFLTYIGLVFLRIDFALPLSIIAGIMEIIPVIGPILSSIPAILVALTMSPFLALAVAALFFIVQQVENHIIVPVVMNKAVGLSPLVVIISLMVGSRIAGVVGAILAIPLVVMIRSIVVTSLTQHQD